MTKNKTPVDDKMVELVEDLVGMGHGAWDMVDPKELIAACQQAAELRAVMEQAKASE